MKNAAILLSILLITVTACQEKPVAKFNYDCSGACLAPVIVNFRLETGNAERVQWDFGDGHSSTRPNPMHEYSTAGTYAVTLTVFNGDRTDEYTDEVIIDATPTRLVVQQVELLAFPDKTFNDGFWDPGEGGIGTFPDLYFTFTGEDIEYEPNLSFASRSNTQSGQLPLEWAFNPAVELGKIDEIYRLTLFDKDLQEDEVIGYAEILPSEFIVRKYYPAEVEIYRNDVRYRLFLEWR